MSSLHPTKPVMTDSGPPVATADMARATADITRSQAEAAAEVQVLIPQHYPGAFYYPPCKCDLVNQVNTTKYQSKF